MTTKAKNMPINFPPVYEKTKDPDCTYLRTIDQIMIRPKEKI